MNQLITGLHHVTVMASDAQKNVDFYAGILGLRMVKKTINFDAPDVYHLNERFAKMKKMMVTQIEPFQIV
jgi:catechol-2,3-dioxygenase